MSLTIDGVYCPYSPDDGDWGQWASGMIQQGVGRPGSYVQVHPDLYVTEHGLNLTSLRSGVVVDMTGTTLVGRRCPALVDRTDSTGISLLHPTLLGDPSSPPVIGLLDSRSAEGKSRSSGKHYTPHPKIAGSFQHAAYVNVGSEMSGMPNAHLRNDRGPAAIWAATNTRNFASSWKTVHNDESATGGCYPDLRAGCTSSSADGTIVVEGYDRLDFSGMLYLYSSHAPHLVLDTQHGAIVSPKISNLYAHGAKGGKPKHCVVLKGSRGHGIVSLSLSASRLIASDYAIYNPTPLKLTNARIEHHEALPEYWHPNTIAVRREPVGRPEYLHV